MYRDGAQVGEVDKGDAVCLPLHKAKQIIVWRLTNQNSLSALYYPTRVEAIVVSCLKFL